MLDENEMRAWEQRSSRGLLGGKSGTLGAWSGLTWLIDYWTEHRWSEEVKITGKSRKKYELSIINVEADLNFIIPKTIPLIVYPQKFFVSYPLSLESFVHLSLIPKTPNRASIQNLSRQIFNFQFHDKANWTGKKHEMSKHKHSKNYQS